MVFFTVMFHVLIWALCIGVVVSIIVFVPLGIYAIPYCLWVGRENTMGRQTDKKKEKFTQTIRNATKLYGAWIHHKKPSL